MTARDQHHPAISGAMAVLATVCFFFSGVQGNPAGVQAPVTTALGRLIAGLLVGVQPRDALTLSASAALLALAALTASLLPALRATRIDPVRALRGE